MEERKISQGSLSMASELGKTSDLWVQKIRTYFCRLDLNCDGKLTIQDFEELAGRFKEYGNLDKARADRLRSLLVSWWRLISQSKESLSCEEFMLSYVPFVKNSFLKVDAESRIGNLHREMFRVIDHDQNGAISTEEYELFLKCIGITNKSFVKMAFESIDRDHDESISEDEFVNAGINFFLSESCDLNKNIFGPLMNTFPLDAHRLSQLWFRKLTTLFCRMDPQEENVISRFTMGSIASRFMSADMSDEERTRISDTFSQLWSHISHRDDEVEIGDHTYVELAGFRLKDPVAKDSLREDDRKVFTHIFNLLDSNQDGVITLDDYTGFLAKLGDNNAENAELAFYSLDANGRGAIDEEQFVRAALNFLYNEEDDRSKFFVGPLIEI